MKKTNLYIAAVALLTLSSCGLTKPYERGNYAIDTEVYRADQIATTTDTTSFGTTPWRELFTDPQLQQLITTALAKNIDLQSAALNVEQAEAQLRAAKLSFYPSFTFAPSGTLTSWDYADPTKAYSLPVQASWQADLFGRLRNAKAAAQSIMLQSRNYQVAVQTGIVAGVANSYYTLLMLDEQLALTKQTIGLTQRTLELMEALKTFGQADEASVLSARSHYLAVQASVPQIERQITTTENALSLLLGEAPHAISRGKLYAQSLPNTFPMGVPASLLANRADVRAAELNLAACYYQTQVARAAFYPSLNVTATAAWTNNVGAIINPGSLLASAVAGLTQPIFAKGQLRANLRVAEATQQKAFLAWQQSVLKAGSEVSNALALYKASNERTALLAQQVEALEQNVTITQDLFTRGASKTYLEVVQAQQSLLSAQLAKIADDFNRMQAVVNLYYALGGGAQ